MSLQGRQRNVWLHGSSGRMGLEIQKALVAQPEDFRLVGGSARKFEGETLLQGRPVTAEALGDALAKDKIDLVVDFSTPDGNELLREAVARNKGKLGVLIGTTGLSEDALERWGEISKGRNVMCLVAPNTSLGILLTVKAALAAAVPLSRLGFDIEITETHHRQKRDAPSGTALFLAETLASKLPGKHVASDRRGLRRPEEIGVHAIRGGGVFGEHEIRFLGDNEEITISHRAFSRALFASGALVLGRWLLRQKPGLYGLFDVDEL